MKIIAHLVLLLALSLAVTARPTKNCSQYDSHLEIVQGLCGHQGEDINVVEQPSQAEQETSGTSGTSNSDEKNLTKIVAKLDFYMKTLQKSLNNSIQKLKGLKSKGKNIKVKNNCSRFKSDTNQKRLCVLFRLVSYTVALKKSANATKNYNVTKDLNTLSVIMCKVHQLDRAALAKIDKCEFINELPLTNNNKVNLYMVLENLHKYLPIARKDLENYIKKQPQMKHKKQSTKKHPTAKKNDGKIKNKKKSIKKTNKQKAIKE